MRMFYLLWACLIILKDLIVINNINKNKNNINNYNSSSLKKHKRLKKATL